MFYSFADLLTYKTMYCIPKFDSIESFHIWKRQQTVGLGLEDFHHECAIPIGELPSVHHPDQFDLIKVTAAINIFNGNTGTYLQIHIRLMLSQLPSPNLTF